MLYFALWVGFLLRVLAAMWNDLKPIDVTKIDAIGFYSHAIQFSKNPVLSDFFSPPVGYDYFRFLGFIYYLTVDSWLLGSIISVLAWLFSAIILMRTMCLLEVSKRHQSYAMLIYAFLPSCILFTSTTLRESFELLFVNFAIYSALKIYLTKSRVHFLITFCSFLYVSLA